MGRLNTTTEVLTLAEARKRLVHVRPLVERLMELTARIRDMAREESAGDSLPESAERTALEESFRTTLAEMNSLGAVLKDPATGLIDFYTWHDDDFAFLCWKHGEADIDWWHGLHDGIAGRRPVTDHEAQG